MPETKKYYHNLDVDNNKVINPLLNPLTTAQRTAVGTLLGPLDEGYVCFDTTLNQQYFWDGAAWTTVTATTAWGSITGTLTAQTDLTAYLASNYYPLSSNPAGYLTSSTIPIPTLEQVLTAGNTSEAGLGINLYDSTHDRGTTISFGDINSYNDINGGSFILNGYGLTINSGYLLSPSSATVTLDSKKIFFGNIDGSANELDYYLQLPPIYPGVNLFYCTLPFATGTLTYSVNGVGADPYGNITIPIGTGTVTDVTATSPLSSTGGTTPDISIQQSSGSQDGYLSSTDWTTFNSKEPAIAPGTTSQYWRGDKTWQTFPTIPTVGTWGALNYPTWTSGTPFVKMDAAGSFTLDTTTYQPLLTNPITGTGTLNYVPKWSSSSALTDSSIFDNGTSVGIGTATPSATHKLHVVGNIATTTGINIDAVVANKTGIYGSTNTLDFWAGNNKMGTYTLVGNVANTSYFYHSIGFNNSGGASGTQSAWRIAASVIDTGVNSMIHNQLLIDPQYIHGTFGTGLLRGVYYNPTLTSLNGASHVAWENSSGDIIHGNLATGGAAQMVTADTNGKLATQAIPSTGLKSGTASGTDTYTVSISGVTSYTDGDAYIIKFTNGNTTGCTLNISGVGAKDLYRNNDGALIGGDIQAGGEMICVYDATSDVFRTIGTSPNSIIAYVTNDDSVTLTKGMPVYAFSGTGDRMTVKRAYNTSDATSAQTVGLVMSTSIAANQKGFIIMQGLLDGLSILPTSTFSDGSAVYLGATAGSITATKQYAPNHLVYLGFVTTASNGSAGRMYVRVQNGYELDELHNVQAQSPTYKDTLWYDNTVSPAQWKTASISTILGYTPQVQLNGTGFVKASGTTISYDNSTYTVANSAITPGTNLKITYDSKGLVTAGTTAATSDLSDVTAWTDYSATSTIVGFSAYSVKKIQYKKIDANTMIVQFQIESTTGNGSGTATSFTLPFNASAWGTQYFIYHSLNNNTTQAASACTIAASSNVVNCYASASVGTTWVTATTRQIQGTIIVNIA